MTFYQIYIHVNKSCKRYVLIDVHMNFDLVSMSSIIYENRYDKGTQMKRTYQSILKNDWDQGGQS